MNKDVHKKKCPCCKNEVSLNKDICKKVGIIVDCPKCASLLRLNKNRNLEDLDTFLDRQLYTATY